MRRSSPTPSATSIATRSLSANVIAAKTVDTQRALVAQLEAQIKSDDAAIESTRAVLGYASVVAPISGRTGMRLIDVGNLVRASDGGIVVITEVQPISVLFTLPQQDLPDINRAVAKHALKVEALETDSKNVLDTGELQVIDNQVDQTTGTIRLKADFPNKDLQLWPGQFVNVRLLLEHAGAGRRGADLGGAARPRWHVRLRRRQR